MVARPSRSAGAFGTKQYRAAYGEPLSSCTRIHTQAAGTERFTAQDSTHELSHVRHGPKYASGHGKEARALLSGHRPPRIVKEARAATLFPQRSAAKVNYRSAGGSALEDRAHPGQNAFVNATKNAPWSIVQFDVRSILVISQAMRQVGTEGFRRHSPRSNKVSIASETKTSGANRNHRQRPVWGTGSRELPRKVLWMGDSGVTVL